MNSDCAIIKGVLLDLDGVFYVGKQAIDGALETLKKLQENSIPYRFITNTSTKSVGDDIENDVGGGQACGLIGTLVKTGKYRAEMARNSEISPENAIDSIADLPTLLGLN